MEQRRGKKSNGNGKEKEKVGQKEWNRDGEQSKRGGEGKEIRVKENK